ncbi:O-antigen ligase family protein [Veronia nyctiphanis]|nr:O-antigen ligase family protein [Veronia nyctiphanis]
MLASIGGVAAGVYAIYVTQIIGQAKASSVVNPIPFALYCLLCFLFSIHACLSSPLSKTHTIFALGLLGSISAIFLSGVRGIWIALPVVIALVIMLNKRWSLRYKSIFAISVLVILSSLGFYFKDSLEARVAQTKWEFSRISQGNLESSVGWRLGMWEVGYNWVKESPLLGIGYSQIKPKAERDDLNERVRFYITNSHFHNQFIDILVRNGLLGLVIFLFWLLLPAYLLATKAKSHDRALGYSCLAGILIASLTDVPFHHTHIMYTYSFLIGSLLLVNLANPLSEEY